MPIDEYFRAPSHEGLEERLAQLYPDAAEREQRAPALRRAARVRDRDDPEDGLPGLLPDRRRLHQLGARRNGCPVGPGPRLGRRLAGRLRARHHRPRSAALRPAVRALPQSRARVDARLRHRLLPGRPRPRHRLRRRTSTAATRVADRHLRHDGGEGRGARRRPRARHELRLRRRHRQADPVPAGQAVTLASATRRRAWSRDAPELEQRERTRKRSRELLDARARSSKA